MKLNAFLSLSLMSLAALAADARAADADDAVVNKKVVVAVKTDDVELHAMDISHLQPGDAETVYTENGKTIDVLRTEDDVEIYIDGQLLDIGPAHGAHHRVVHAQHQNIEIDCADEAECDELIWLGDDEEFDPAQLHDGKKVYIVKKEVIRN